MRHCVYVKLTGKRSSVRMVKTGLQIIFFIRFVNTVPSSERCAAPTYSVTGYYLKNHVTASMPSSDLAKCFMKCSHSFWCKSFNFRLSKSTCELNDAERHTHPEDYGPHRDYVYSDTAKLHIERGGFKTCADIQAEIPTAKSGYYWVSIRNRDAQVYCDMKTYGGGWTLVVGISKENIHHTLVQENDCLNSVLCVPYEESNIAARKLSDFDIHQLAANEGIFRLDARTTNVTSFYKIPSGPEHFNASCVLGTCPRIIVSHSFPYRWETSNCTTTDEGYKIYNGCHRVFDAHDNGECDVNDVLWLSSQYYTARVLYAYSCDADPVYSTMGIYPESEGMLFVK